MEKPDEAVIADKSNIVYDGEGKHRIGRSVIFRVVFVINRLGGPLEYRSTLPVLICYL